MSNINYLTTIFSIVIVTTSQTIAVSSLSWLLTKLALTKVDIVVNVPSSLLFQRIALDTSWHKVAVFTGLGGRDSILRRGTQKLGWAEHSTLNIAKTSWSLVSQLIAWLSLCFILERSWVALYSDVCQSVQCVRHRCHPTKSPLFPIYTGIQALCWPCTT